MSIKEIPVGREPPDPMDRDWQDDLKHRQAIQRMRDHVGITDHNIDEPYQTYDEHWQRGVPEENRLRSPADGMDHYARYRMNADDDY